MQEAERVEAPPAADPGGREQQAPSLGPGMFGLRGAPGLVALRSSSALSIDQWRHSVSAELAQVYRDASTPGWDGYDALVVEPDTYAYALKFRAFLEGQIPEPEIMAHPDGELAFEWYRGRRWVFTVAVGRDGTLNYAGAFGVDVSKGREKLRDSLPATILEGIRRVVSRA